MKVTRWEDSHSVQIRYPDRDEWNAMSVDPSIKKVNIWIAHDLESFQGFKNKFPNALNIIKRFFQLGYQVL